MQKVLVIVGPTSSGKTGLAVELAKRFGGEVISADSRQVYRGLDIGTGKVTKREMKGVPHHVLDVASPKRVFSAAEYVREAREALDAVQKRKKLPIVAGGTGFYIDSLLGSISLPDVPRNAKLRERLAQKSASQLFAMLRKADQKRARMLSTPSERNNKVRLIRAMEIALAKRTPKPTDAQSTTYDVLWLGITVSKQSLEKKIRARLRSRLKQGMLAEGRRVHAEGLSYKRMEALGLEYRAMALFLQGKLSRREMEERLAMDIVHYAKRQMTYWKRNKNIRWVERPTLAKVTRTIERWLATPR